MGGGNSTESNTRVVNNQLIVNENDLTLVAKNINKSTTNLLEKTAKSCNQSSNPSQVVESDFGDIGGDYNSGNVSLDMSATFNAKCVQDSNIQSDFVKEVSQKMAQSLKDSMKNDAFATLAAKAEALKQTAFMAPPSFGDRSTSNSNIENNITQINKDKKNLTNIIENVTNNNITKENVQQCIQSADPVQLRRDRAKRVGGTVTIGDTTMKMSTNVVMDCLQVEKQVLKIAEKAAASMEMQLVTEKSASSKVDAAAASSSKAIATGPLEGLAGLLGAGMIPIIISVVASVICVLIIGVVGVLVGPKIMDMMKPKNPMDQLTGAMGAASAVSGASGEDA